jgi:hypothetical protein
MTEATRPLTNMPEAVYRCDLITRKSPYPRNEVFVSAHPCAMEAMIEARRLKRLDPGHSYIVGSA